MSVHWETRRIMDEDILKAIDPRELGRRLQEARKASGRTQQDVADHLGIARTTVTAIEKGDRRVQPGELIRLASLLGRSVGEFLRQAQPAASFAV
jgi:transcriptional regulator with XRE-family HTH domain